MMVRDDVRVVVLVVVAAAVEVRNQYPAEEVNHSKLRSAVRLQVAAAAMVPLRIQLVVMWANLAVLLLFLLFPGHDARVEASSSQLYLLRNDPVPKTTLPFVLPVPPSCPLVLVAVLADQSAVLGQPVHIVVHIAVHSSVRLHMDQELVAGMDFQVGSSCLVPVQLVVGNLTEAGEDPQ